MATIWIQAVVMALFASGILAAPTNQTVQCEYGGKMWSEGDLVTGDSCDQCHCSRFGIMCSLLSCPPTPCVDAVKLPGKCCRECPNGPNAMFRRPGREPIVIPCLLFGCQLDQYNICYCYQSEAYCYPPFPFNMSPPCFPDKK